MEPKKKLAMAHDEICTIFTIHGNLVELKYIFLMLKKWKFLCNAKWANFMDPCNFFAPYLRLISIGFEQVKHVYFVHRSEIIFL